MNPGKKTEDDLNKNLQQEANIDENERYIEDIPEQEIDPDDNGYRPIWGEGMSTSDCNYI